jgi:hypothetical protein
MISQIVDVSESFGTIWTGLIGGSGVHNNHMLPHVAPVFADLAAQHTPNVAVKLTLQILIGIFPSPDEINIG